MEGKIGPFRREIDALQLAYAFEQATGVGERRPQIAL
jgi:hypothetical protein